MGDPATGEKKGLSLPKDSKSTCSSWVTLQLVRRRVLVAPRAAKPPLRIGPSLHHHLHMR